MILSGLPKWDRGDRPVRSVGTGDAMNVSQVTIRPLRVRHDGGEIHPIGRTQVGQALGRASRCVAAIAGPTSRYCRTSGGAGKDSGSAGKPSRPAHAGRAHRSPTWTSGHDQTAASQASGHPGRCDAGRPGGRRAMLPGRFARGLAELTTREGDGDRRVHVREGHGDHVAMPIPGAGDCGQVPRPHTPRRARTSGGVRPPGRPRNAGRRDPGRSRHRGPVRLGIRALAPAVRGRARRAGLQPCQPESRAGHRIRRVAALNRGVKHRRPGRPLHPFTGFARTASLPVSDLEGSTPRPRCPYASPCL